MKRRGGMLAVAFVVGARAAAAAPLDAADQGSADTQLATLATDPFADTPLAALERIYEHGPGRAALAAEVTRRAHAQPSVSSWSIVLARLALKRGRPADAAKELAGAVKRTHEPATLRRIARLLDESNAWDAALKAYEGGLAGASPQEERLIRLRMGALLLARGKTGPALDTWRKVLDAYPRDASLRREMAETLASRGLVPEALAMFKQLEALLMATPDGLIPVLRREADLQERAGDRAGASRTLLNAFLAAAAASQELAEVELAGELLRLGGGKHPSPELVAMIKRAAASDPSAGALEAELLMARGEKARAVAAFQAVKRSRPTDRYVLRRLAGLEPPDARRRELAELFRLEKSDAALGFELLRSQLEVKAASDAAQTSRVMRERFHDNPVILAELAEVLGKGGQHVEALAAADRAIALDPDRPDAVLCYADELRANGRAGEAERAYFRLVEHASSSSSYRNLINVLERRGLGPLLSRAYTDALTRWPDDGVLRRDFARWLHAQGQLDDAQRQWRTLRERTKDGFLRDYATREIDRIENEKMLQGK